MSIIVKTQLGTGGPWFTNCELTKGPRNLLKAVKTAHEEIRSNKGVGGYRTLIVVDGVVLSNWGGMWPSTMAEAKSALAKTTTVEPWLSDDDGSSVMQYAEIASNWYLWNEYVNTDATMDRDEFDSMTVDQKIALQVEMFGPEQPAGAEQNG